MSLWAFLLKSILGNLSNFWKVFEGRYIKYMDRFGV